MEPSKPMPSPCRKSVASSVEIGESESYREAENEDRTQEVNDEDAGTPDDPDRESAERSPFVVHASSYQRRENTALSCKRRINEAREARMRPPLVSCSALLCSPLLLLKCGRAVVRSHCHDSIASSLTLRKCA